MLRINDVLILLLNVQGAKRKRVRRGKSDFKHMRTMNKKNRIQQKKRKKFLIDKEKRRWPTQHARV